MSIFRRTLFLAMAVSAQACVFATPALEQTNNATTPENNTTSETTGGSTGTVGTTNNETVGGTNNGSTTAPTNNGTIGTNNGTVRPECPLNLDVIGAVCRSNLVDTCGEIPLPPECGPAIDCGGAGCGNGRNCAGNLCYSTATAIVSARAMSVAAWGDDIVIGDPGVAGSVGTASRVDLATGVYPLLNNMSIEDQDAAFGSSVATFNGYAVVGGPRYHTLGTDSGKVQMRWLDRNDPTNNWNVGSFLADNMPTTLPSNQYGGWRLGAAVAAGGVGNLTRAFVGAPGINAVFTFDAPGNGAPFQTQGQIPPGELRQGSAEFGAAIASNRLGNRLVIGAPGGRIAELWSRNAVGIWSQDFVLEPMGESERFGETVAISDAGDYVAVGDPAFMNDHGSVHLYVVSDAGTADLIERIEVNGNDAFGRGLAFQGPVLWVGAPGNRRIRAYFGARDVGAQVVASFDGTPELGPTAGFGMGIAAANNRLIVIAPEMTATGKIWSKEGP